MRRIVHRNSQSFAKMNKDLFTINAIEHRRSFRFNYSKRTLKHTWWKSIFLFNDQSSRTSLFRLLSSHRLFSFLFRLTFISTKKKSRRTKARVKSPSHLLVVFSFLHLFFFYSHIYTHILSLFPFLLSSFIDILQLMQDSMLWYPWLSRIHRHRQRDFLLTWINK